MKWWLVSVALLGLLACRDPNSYQPFDPTNPDPPAPPVLAYPADGWMSDDYAYPQNVSFAWQAVPGAQFYEMQVNDDSLFPGTRPFWRVYQTSVVYSFQTFGVRYWRVRAVSSNWNNYTNWSAPFHFSLPNPGR
jgi:hypothetical protein